jgi:hypothetical protein
VESQFCSQFLQPAWERGLFHIICFGKGALPVDWLKSEFSLNEHQAAQITALQSQYAKACEEMCARINETDARVADLIRSQKIVTSEIRKALSESDRLRTECRLKMLEHCYEVANAMPEEERDKYIEMVLPMILDPGRMADAH